MAISGELFDRLVEQATSCYDTNTMPLWPYQESCSTASWSSQPRASTRPVSPILNTLLSFHNCFNRRNQLMLRLGDPSLCCIFVNINKLKQYMHRRRRSINLAVAALGCIGRLFVFFFGRPTDAVVWISSAYAACFFKFL